MIAIVSSSARERVAFAALCESRGWPTIECDSLGAALRLLRRSPPRIVLMRHKLTDGYSDEVLALIVSGGLATTTKTLVLIAAGSPTALEARQLALGADCVQRDPVRTDVLVEYLAKYLAASAPFGSKRPPPMKTRPFAGGTLRLIDRRLLYRGAAVCLTPREVALVERLVASTGEVVSYESLYSEILGRRFRGDTSNMRVLLGKLTASAARIGIPLRDWIEVIPKMGYSYRRPRQKALRITKTTTTALSAA